MPTTEKINALRNKLIRWSEAYHNTGTPLVSDEEYDRALDLLEKWSPNDKFLQRVGAPVQGAKVKLKYPMPSLSKIREDKGAADWLNRSSGRIAVLDKLDGSACMVEQETQNTQRLFSRGNGAVGQDITRILPYIKGIPKKFTTKYAVRGELMLSATDFSAFQDDLANARSAVNGLVNSSKNINKTLANNVKFIAHELLNPKISWDKARVQLKSLGFDTAFTKVFNKPTVKELTDYYKGRRKKSPYELDGLVLIDLQTKEKISFKVNKPAQKAIVSHVEWNISPNKLYKPKVILKTPVIIDGTKISKASGHNAAYILEHGIGPGAEILIVKSGDVIPWVTGVVKKVKPQLPDHFKWNESKIEAIATKLTNEQETILLAKRLVKALNALGIDGVKIGLATKLVDAGVPNIVDLLYLNRNEIQQTGIGNVYANKLYDAITNYKRNATHATFMEASGIWPKGYTITRFTLILERYPLPELIKQWKASKLQLRDDIAAIPQMSSASALEFMRYLPEYVRLVKTLPFKIKQSVEKSASNLLQGQVFCFTKVRSKEVESWIIKNGGKISNSLTNNVTILLVKDKFTNSDKTEATKARKIKIMPLADFIKQNKIK